MKILLTPLFHLLWRVRVEGREHIPRHGPAVLAANHRSFCDSLFLPLVVPRRVTFLAKAEYFESRKTAWFFRAVGEIPVRRGGGPEAVRALETAREILGRGRLLAVYPEGTRGLDGRVHRGRTGVARLSGECGVPVVPVGITGTVDVQPVDARMLRPFRTVVVRFGAPVRMAPAGGREHGGAGRTGDHEGGCAVPTGDHEHAAYRRFTEDLMREIARLSGCEYEDGYVPRRPAP